MDIHVYRMIRGICSLYMKHDLLFLSTNKFSRSYLGTKGSIFLHKISSIPASKSHFEVAGGGVSEPHLDQGPRYTPPSHCGRNKRVQHIQHIVRYRVLQERGVSRSFRFIERKFVFLVSYCFFDCVGILHL